MSNTIALEICIQAGEPCVSWGSPGTGKTKWEEALCNHFDWLNIQMIASTREPVDFSGMPVIQEDGTVTLQPIGRWFKDVMTTKKKRVIVHFDEISTAPPAVQAALLKLIHEKIYGEHILPDYVSFIASANPPDEAANGWAMTPPMANRFFHFFWNPTTDDWIQGMISGWQNQTFQVLPDNWKDLIPSHRSLVASFIKTRPNLLQDMPKDESARGYAWPSRRSWDMAARLLADGASISASKDINRTLVSGCVGDGVAVEFVSWLDALDLPNPEDLLKDPSSFKMPARGDQLFAILTSVTTAVLQNNTASRWYAGWKVLEEVIRQNKPDVAAIAAIALANNQPNGASIPPTLNAFGPLLKKVGVIS